MRSAFSFPSLTYLLSVTLSPYAPDLESLARAGHGKMILYHYQLVRLGAVELWKTLDASESPALLTSNATATTKDTSNNQIQLSANVPIRTEYLDIGYLIKPQRHFPIPRQMFQYFLITVLHSFTTLSIFVFLLPLPLQFFQFLGFNHILPRPCRKTLPHPHPTLACALIPSHHLRKFHLPSFQLLPKCPSNTQPSKWLSTANPNKASGS